MSTEARDWSVIILSYTEKSRPTRTSWDSVTKQNNNSHKRAMLQHYFSGNRLFLLKICLLGWAMPSAGTWGRTHLPGGWKAPLAQPLLQSQSQGQSFLCSDSGFPCSSWLKALWLPGIAWNDSKWLQRLRGNLLTSSDAICLAQLQTVWVHSKTIAVCVGALTLAPFWPLSFPHLQKRLSVHRPTAVLINSVIHQ